MSIGIYKIENLINHKIYIGQSTHIEKRWYEHCSYKENIIGKAISKYGKDNFDFQILEKCSIDELDQKEIYYINKYNSLIPNGYNVTSGGKANHEIFYFNDKQTIEAIREDLLNSNLSFEDLSKKYNLSLRAIYYINDGTYHHSDDYPYPIREVRDQTKKEWFCKDCGKIVSKGCYYCKSCAMKKHYINSPGNLISREELKDLVRTMPFTRIGQLFNVTDNAVRKWCDKYDLPRKSSEIKNFTDEEWLKI